MKYVIEIPSKADFVTAYYMEDGLPVMYKSDRIDDLEPYTEPDRKAIEDAQEKAWELASAIVCPSDCNVGSIQKHCKEIFGVDTWEIRGIFTNNTYQEAKTKYEAWVKQKNEIKVGDEIILGRDQKLVVTRVDEGNEITTIQAVDEDGECYECIELNEVNKTGRHFDEVEELLEKMRGDSDGTET